MKNTASVIPDCHPMPIEYTGIAFECLANSVQIEVTVKTIYKTGVEVEAMHGAAVTALTIYDMLKPIDKSIEISSIKLQSKEGGKSDFSKESWTELSCAVIVCSDTVSKGEAIDSSGKVVIERLKQYGLKTVVYEIIPDDLSTIRSKAESLSNKQIDLLLFSGGTGLSTKDVTPEAIAPLIETSIPGIMEELRHYGQQRMPYAILSRGVAGFIKNSLVLTLPGSVKAVHETMDALFPHILHVFKVRSGYRHS